MCPRPRSFLTVSLPAVAAVLGVLTCTSPAAPGELDLTFQGTGWVHVPAGIGGAADMALQPDGKILLTGEVKTAPGESRMAVWRFHPDGSPDLSFGAPGTGEVIIPHGTSSAGRVLKVSDSGRISVVGSYVGPPLTPGGLRYPQSTVVSLLPDGRPDPAFGPNSRGWVETEFFGAATALALQPDGKILFSNNAATPVYVARLLPGGAPDPSFGSPVSSGAAELALVPGVGSSGVNVLAVQPDGKILAARVDSYFTLTRILPDGSADLAFGVGGTFSLYGLLSGVVGACQALSVRQDGRILAAGRISSSVTAEHFITVVSLLPGGVPDPDFGDPGTPGQGLIPLPAGNFAFGGMAVQQEGGILVTGTVGAPLDPGGYEIVIARFTPEGRADTFFGDAGLIRTGFGPSLDRARAAALPTDRKLVIAGGYSTGPGAAQELLLARYHVPGAGRFAVEHPPGTELPSLDFGPVTSGTSVIELTLRNDGLPVPLTDLQATLTDQSAPGDFAVTFTGPAALSPGAAAVLTLILTPSAAPGLRTATLRLTTATPGIPPRLLALTGSKATPLQIWRFTYFGSPDNSGPGADLNDFDRDGLPNFLEYATASHPHTPSPSVLRSAPGTPAAFTYTRPAAALTGFSYTPESAVSPAGPWSSAGLVSTVLTDDGTVQTVQVTPAGATLPRFFLRLRVTKL